MNGKNAQQKCTAKTHVKNAWQKRKRTAKTHGKNAAVNEP